MRTNGCKNEDLDALVGTAGAGAFVHAVHWAFEWHAKDLDLESDASGIFTSVPGRDRPASIPSHFNKGLGVQVGLVRLMFMPLMPWCQGLCD